MFSGSLRNNVTDEALIYDDSGRAPAFISADLIGRHGPKSMYMAFVNGGDEEDNKLKTWAKRTLGDLYSEINPDWEAMEGVTS